MYFQIGLLTVLGLTTKNAILIVQFAMAKVHEGMSLIEATLEGAKLRLRPIVMTSLAFGFGVLPLALATGAGAGAQTAIGTGVLGGMATATFLAIFFIPLFFVVVYGIFGKKKRYQTDAPGAVLHLCGVRCQSRVFLSRSALLTTDSELKLIAAAAITGLSRSPNAGYRTPAAIGTPSAL